MSAGMDAKFKMSRLHVLAVFMFWMIRLSVAAGNLSPGESLSGAKTLVSKGGIFELGLFTPGQSRKYYLGIRYRTIPQQMIIWVANRDTPLSDDLFELRISEVGNLVLFNRYRVQVWSTNSSTNGINSTTAELLDSGNLILRARANASAIIWQSFDHPTDTWLPGGWLGRNKLTGENQRLISWRNMEDPSPGPFSLELDPDGTNQYVILWNRTRQYWSSGLWNNQTQIFDQVPEMRSTFSYNFTFTSTDRGVYFSYSVYDPTLLSRFVVNLSGQAQQLSWAREQQVWIPFWSQPRARCDPYSLCGPFGICNPNGLPVCSCVPRFYPKFQKDWNLSDWTGGCLRRVQLSCGNSNRTASQTDGFYLMPDMGAPSDAQSLSLNSQRDCELACLNDCSCTAYSYTSGCSLWNGTLLNLKQLSSGDSGGINLYLRLAATEIIQSRLNDSHGRSISLWVVSVAVVGSVALLGIIVVVLWGHRRRRFTGGVENGPGSVISFTYRDLQAFTKNFSEKIGGGGFGSVFRGTLPDRSLIAVKKLEGLRQGDKQFRTEVSTIGTIQHVNLVRLRGFCSEGTKRLLVYDYMPKGSLDAHLLHENSEVLDWQTRYSIAIGTARALAYLHGECRDCIIHCDIKPENILLDANFCPKVADFGLAKLVGREFSRVLTTMRGTRGYLAPEWISGLAITPKADVYSYGMMLFEIISGRRNSQVESEGNIVFFPVTAAKKVAKDEFLGLLDYRLHGEAPQEELKRALQVACWCIQDDEASRPSMVHVVQILEGAMEVNTPTVPRSLQILAGNSGNHVASKESSSISSELSKSGSSLASSG